MADQDSGKHKEYTPPRIEHGSWFSAVGVGSFQA
jgi:hypothetical protein